MLKTLTTPLPFYIVSRGRIFATTVSPSCVRSFKAQVEINETGTTLKFKPGYVIGGRVSHDCGTTRSLGWFVEGLIPLAIFRYGILVEGVTALI